MGTGGTRTGVRGYRRGSGGGDSSSFHSRTYPGPRTRVDSKSDRQTGTPYGEGERPIGPTFWDINRTFSRRLDGQETDTVCNG